MWYLYLSEPPVSHLETARSVTPSFSPRAAWVYPRSLRQTAINFPIFS